MIIKSMSRKDASFGQLIEYMSDINKSDEQYNVYQNIYSKKGFDIEEEFKKNAWLMKKRKNGVYLYHEILSITKAKGISLKQQKEALRYIAYKYALDRAPKNLVFGTLHDDHDEHLHYHLLISANALGDPKKTRLSKKQFDNLKKDMEKHVLKNHPELEQKVVINRQVGEKLSNKEYEYKKRTGKKSDRDTVKDNLTEVFSDSKNKQDLFTKLSESGYELYIRGKTIGVKKIETGKNYRLKTLGLLDKFEQLSEIIAPTVDKNSQNNNNKKDESENKQEKAKTESKQKEQVNKDTNKTENTVNNKDDREKNSKKGFLNKVKTKLKRNKMRQKQSGKNKTR
ncbi:MAG: relaxase/mobilization nuclease domain-containing protein [Gammaproteobacteria bacterium]|nr:relaxase/mobilization nuclease domain-containing protein [Gammaproteobacteria bacterium]